MCCGPVVEVSCTFAISVRSLCPQTFRSKPKPAQACPEDHAGRGWRPVPFGVALPVYDFAVEHGLRNLGSDMLCGILGSSLYQQLLVWGGFAAAHYKCKTHASLRAQCSCAATSKMVMKGVASSSWCRLGPARLHEASAENPTTPKRRQKREQMNRSRFRDGSRLLLS